MFSEMSYHVQRYMAFKPKDECYGQNHGIVFQNDPILCTGVHLVMENNVAEERFHFQYTKKSFSIFRVQKMGFFVKQQPQICCKNWDMHFLSILDHVRFTNNQSVGCEKFSMHFF